MKTGRIPLGIALLAAAAVGVAMIMRERPAPPVLANASGRPAVSPQSENPMPLAAKPSRPARLIPTPTADAGVARENQLRETARTWARADLPAVAAWLLTLSEADAAIAEEAVLAEIGRNDVPSAIALAQALRRGVDDGRVEHMAQIWTEEDPAAAVAWISGLTAGADRDRLLARVALVRVAQDPAEAARLLGAMTDGPARDAALAATIARLRIYDPIKADTWQAMLAKPQSG